MTDQSSGGPGAVEGSAQEEAGAGAAWSAEA